MKRRYPSFPQTSFPSSHTTVMSREKITLPPLSPFLATRHQFLTILVTKLRNSLTVLLAPATAPSALSVTVTKRRISMTVLSVSRTAALVLRVTAAKRRMSMTVLPVPRTAYLVLRVTAATKGVCCSWY